MILELAYGGFLGALFGALILIFVTFAIHVSGLASLAFALPRFWQEDVSGRKSVFDTIPGTVSIITAVAFVLAIFHGIEALIWAIVYLWIGAQPSILDAILYSLGAMSTAGSGLTVHPPWRIMGAIESFDGILLFGISTAFLFSTMRLLWRSVAIRRGAQPRNPLPPSDVVPTDAEPRTEVPNVP